MGAVFFFLPLEIKDGIKPDKLKAHLIFKYLLAVGDLTGTKMNKEKCLGPARVMEILGFIYDSISRSCKLSEKKTNKIFDSNCICLEFFESALQIFGKSRRKLDVYGLDSSIWETVSFCIIGKNKSLKRL